MNYKFENAEKSTVKITINLDAAEWEQAQKDAYEKTKGKYAMQGFRKGKVPMKVLENAYGKGIFFEDAINEAFPKYYYDILQKEPSIDAVASPSIDVDKIGEEGIAIIAIVPVKPEVKLGEYKGIKFDKVEYNVKDEDVDAEIERLKERNSRMVEVTDRAAADGDTVNIDYSGSVDGEKFQGGTAEKQDLTLGSKTFIPGFEEQVVGLEIGGERDITVKFPEDYQAENLKGKEAVFAIKLHSIKVKELPEVTDDFIKDATGTATLAEYRQETKDKLTKQNNERAERELEDKIVKAITEKSEAVIPDAMIENQVDHMVKEMEYRLSYQGLKLNDYLKYMGQTIEEYKKGYQAQAQEIVKSQLVIEKIIKDENIEATEEDVQAKVDEMAKEQNKPAIDVKKNINARQMDYVKNEIIIKKLFDFLRTNNTIE